MKALALHPFFAAMVAAGEKRVEYRSWNTNYRGYLLICATLKKEEPCFPRGHALAVVAISRTRQTKDGNWSWYLKDVTPIIPVPVKCQQRIFESHIDPSEVIPLSVEDSYQLFEYWQSLGLARDIDSIFADLQE